MGIFVAMEICCAIQIDEVFFFASRIVLVHSDIKYIILHDVFSITVCPFHCIYLFICIIITFLYWTYTFPNRVIQTSAHGGTVSFAAGELSSKGFADIPFT